MSDVTLTIDGVRVTVPAGTLIVDAAKRVGIDVPVFCYHPKMEPVGMCRMCLVEIGRPMFDRTTKEPVLEADGTPKITFGPKLETACTTPVSEGMVVHNNSEKALAGRKDIIEFLLTSHPLDCPICDKGGECPLQNLTMAYGPGQSRFLLDEKMRLAKHLPLGELIYLDRERCIQCGRCVRFQNEIVDEPVIGFYHRGRAFEIITFSEPGFDSIFSGNTTDICPVGALTTADFRFQARPWELKGVASICTQCPVGCNITLDTRREAAAGGNFVVKRVMPRQNEAVNEIWICDKGRFGYHYTQDPMRLTTPLVRKDGALVPATWDEALAAAAAGLRRAGTQTAALAGGRLSNEDLFNLRQLAEGLGGKAILDTNLAGGDLTARVGLAEGSNFGTMGAGSVILVVASDLEQEAPIWYLRVLGAAKRGAQVIVINPRTTTLDGFASHKLRYPYGAESGMILALLNQLSPQQGNPPEAVQTIARSPEVKAAGEAFAQASDAVVIFGSEGLGLAASTALSQACASLLTATGHVGRPNNGLLGVRPRANDQGAWDLGWRPEADLAGALGAAQALIVAASDPLGDYPQLDLGGKFLVVQELFLTATAAAADVVLPVQAFTEREGSLTNGERRVQRYYPAVPALTDTRPDFAIAAQLGQLLGIEMSGRWAAEAFEALAAAVPAYAGLNYPRLAQVEPQWPIVGRGDLYYGGTTYDNQAGLGVKLPAGAARGDTQALNWPALPQWDFPEDTPLAVPITRIYDRGRTLQSSLLLAGRITPPLAILSAELAASLGAEAGAPLEVTLGGQSYVVRAEINAELPPRVVLIPRSVGLPLTGPTPIRLRLAEHAAA